MKAMSLDPRLLPSALGLLLFASCSMASGQKTSGQKTSGQSAPAPAGPVDTLRVTARIVYVDVVVRDNYGHVVPGLSESSFELLENKQPQRISLFEEHTQPALPPQSTPAPAPESPAHVAEISNLIPGAPNTSLNMVLLDLLNTAPLDQAYARQRMISFLRALPPGRRVALFILSDRLRMVQGFTTDSALLAHAAESIDIRQMHRTRNPGQELADNDMIGYTDFASGGQWGERGASRLGQAISTELVREDIENMKSRLETTNAAFQEITRAVNGFPGRKNLFWLAGQFPSPAYFSLQSLSTSQRGNSGARTNPGSQPDLAAGLASSSARALRTFEERADRALADSQIAVYPISLVGVETDSIGAENSGIGSAGGSYADTSSRMFNNRQDNRSVMNHIAQETGGQAYYGNNDPAQMLKSGFENGENYYTLAYQPQNHKWNGAYRAILVTLKAQGYHFSYRRGYYAVPEQPVGDPISQFASAMRLENPPSTMLLLRATPPASASSGVMQLDATLDLQGVGFATQAQQDRRARLQILLIAYPLGGTGAPAEINNKLTLGFTPEDYARVLATGVPLRQTLHLKPGRYALRLGVLDLASGRIGTLTLPCTMPPT